MIVKKVSYKITIKLNVMNLKRSFGAMLTVLGTAGLVCTSVVFTKFSGNVNDIILFTLYGLVGFVIFMTGLNLVRNAKD